MPPVPATLDAHRSKPAAAWPGNKPGSAPTVSAATTDTSGPIADDGFAGHPGVVGRNGSGSCLGCRASRNQRRSAPVPGRSKVERGEMLTDSISPVRADVAAAEDDRTPRPRPSLGATLGCLLRARDFIFQISDWRLGSGAGFPADSGRPLMGKLNGGHLEFTGGVAAAGRPDFAHFPLATARLLPNVRPA